MIEIVIYLNKSEKRWYVLAQERFERILEILREKQSVTVVELTEKLNTSESTIRRDLTELTDKVFWSRFMEELLRSSLCYQEKKKS